MHKHSHTCIHKFTERRDMRETWKLTPMEVVEGLVILPERMAEVENGEESSGVW